MRGAVRGYVYGYQTALLPTDFLLMVTLIFRVLFVLDSSMCQLKKSNLNVRLGSNPEVSGGNRNVCFRG